MTDFDKLIKEKAEKADYPYSRSAWKSFQKHSGAASATHKFWTIGVSATLIVGTSIGVLLHHKHSEADANQMNEQPSAIHDTMTCISWQDSVQGDVKVVESRKDMAEDGHAVQKIREDNSVVPQEKVQETTGSSVKESHPITRRQYVRPLVIDVDTIKDNVPSDEELKKGNSRIF
jgi:hypothetical protein